MLFVGDISRDIMTLMGTLMSTFVIKPFFEVSIGPH